jgi:MFS family permease
VKNQGNKLLLINMIMLLSVTFTMRSSTNMLMTVVPVFTKYVINADVLFVGLTATLYGIGGMVSNIFVNGRISVDKTPKVVFAFLAVMTLGIFFYIFSTNVYEVLILSAVTGLSMGVVQPLLMTITNAIAPPGMRDRYIAAYTASLSLSLIFGVLVEGLVISSIDVRYAFVIFLFIAMASSILMFFLSRKIRIPAKSTKTRSFKEIISRASTSLHQGKVLFAMFGNISYAFPFILLITYGSIIGREYDGIAPSTFLYLLALFYGVSFLSRVILSVRQVRSKEYLMYAAFAASIVGYVLVGINTGIVMFIAALLILGFPHGSIFPLSTSYIAESVDMEYMNIVYSVFLLIMDVIAFVIPFIFGLISDLYTIKIAIYVTLIPMAFLIMLSVGINIKDNKTKRKNLAASKA